MLADGSGRARNPVRRSNSSPEMSAGWRNPFLSSAAVDREKMEKITKPSYSKDLRYSEILRLLVIANFLFSILQISN